MQGRRSHLRISTLAAVALLLAGCDRETRHRIEPEPGFTRPTVPANPRTVADLFPATASRGLVLNRCSGCHSPACAVLGQRTREEWDEVEYAHTGRVPGMSLEDQGKIFDYLKDYFNETQPEPNVPERFIEGGCPTMEEP